jgi:cytochrome c oxidase subunit 2|tara:strand:+ start:513 stop:1340 length:828 start_codon:yes stop_codon:yes gene_type:complete
MIVALVFLLVLIGSVVFHILTPWWWTSVASNWGSIDDTIILTFWVTGFVFIAVGLFMVYCIWKFKYQKNRRSEYKPEDSKLEFRLTVITTLGVAALLAPGLFVWNKYVTVPKDAYQIEVMAYQWAWGYRLPGKDGKLGKVDIKNINDKNPFGISLKDINGIDDIVILNEPLHLLKNKPVKVLLRSTDVLHNFYVPQFRGKMDMLPGSVTYYWFEPTKTGKFEVLCAEFCGIGHYAMRSMVIVDEEKKYNEWLAKQKSYEQVVLESSHKPMVKLNK